MGNRRDTADTPKEQTQHHARQQHQHAAQDDLVGDACFAGWYDIAHEGYYTMILLGLIRALLHKCQRGAAFAGAAGPANTVDVVVIGLRDVVVDDVRDVRDV